MNEKLAKLTQDSIDYRRKWLEEAIRAQVLADLLPPNIQELTISAIDTSTDGKELQITVLFGDVKDVVFHRRSYGFTRWLHGRFYRLPSR